MHYKQIIIKTTVPKLQVFSRPDLHACGSQVRSDTDHRNISRDGGVSQNT